MSSVRKKYQDFPGKNDFCCDGRFMISKSRGVFYLTLGLIVITSIFFFAFDCPYLATEFSPLFPVVGGILFLFVLSNLLRTSFIDPGIVPRAKASEAEFIQKQLDENQAAAGQNINRPPRTKEMCINGQIVRVKYCYTCKIFRPPRASHCGVCDNCVERFDHHCPWVGNCVGRRNYRYFYLFVLSLSVYCLFVMGSSVTHIVQRGMKTGFLETIKVSPTSVAVILIAFFSVWSVVGLAGFHTFLILKEQTTNEDIKGTFSQTSSQPVANGAGSRAATVPPDFNPYSKPGCCGNWTYTLCGPIPPSLLDPRGIVVESSSMQQSVPTAESSLPGGAGQMSFVRMTDSHGPGETINVGNSVANAGVVISNPGFLAQSQHQSVALNSHPPANAQGIHADLNAEFNNTNSDVNETLTTLCSSPSSPTKVRPILLPAISSAVSYSSSTRPHHVHSSSIAYSQFGQNGDISPECSINVAAPKSTPRQTMYPV